MDAASSAAFTEFINHSITRMDQQQESISSTRRAVQALVTQVSELSQQLQQLRAPTAPAPPTVSPPPSEQRDISEPRLPCHRRIPVSLTFVEHSSTSVLFTSLYSPVRSRGRSPKWHSCSRYSRGRRRCGERRFGRTVILAAPRSRHSPPR